MTSPNTPATGVSVHRDEAVATVSLGPTDDWRPRYGGLDTPAKQALRTVLERLADDTSVRAVVLTGRGSAFCTGQDLREHAAALATDATAAFDTVRQHYGPITLALATMPKPVIAAVNGTAAGAGAAFAFACDLRLLAESASFHLAFGRLGLSVDSGMSWTLPRLVGTGRALELLLRSRPIDAYAALEVGLAHEVVADGGLAVRAAQLAAELAAGPTIAFGATKQALAYAAGNTLADALDMEAALQVVAGTTQDHADAVDAFLDKRPARFSGR